MTFYDKPGDVERDQLLWAHKNTRNRKTNKQRKTDIACHSPARSDITHPLQRKLNQDYEFSAKQNCEQSKTESEYSILIFLDNHISSFNIEYYPNKFVNNIFIFYILSKK